MARGKMAIFGAAALGAIALFGRDAAFTMPPAGHGGALRGGRQAAPAEKAEKAARFELAQSEKAAAVVEEPAAPFSSFLRTALAVVAALAVAIAPMADAQAARSGGRMGGGGMRMGGATRRVAPPPRPGVRSKTNVNIGVGVAPPIYAPSPFGFGFGGFGMPLFAPPLFGPTIALGGGSSAVDEQLQHQQRQDERVIDQQKAQIEQMQKELAELKTQQK